MSVQSAKDFLKKINSDEAFRKSLEAASGQDARMQAIKAAGFDFSEADYKQVVTELAAAAGKELSPEDMQGIAGGVGKRGVGGCIVDTNPCIIHW